MPDISKITLPSGTTYDIKDAVARQQIADIKVDLTGAMFYVGITTTALTDGSTTATLVIDGESRTFTTDDAGATVIYGDMEFVWNGSKWQEFGSTGSLKALAFKDTASASYTPAGTVTKPTFTGTATTSTGKFTPEGTCTGTAVTLNTTTVNSMTSEGTLPTLTTTVANENLTIAFDRGTLPTKGNDTTVATSVKTVTQPTFNGTEGNVSVSGTPTGEVSQPTFNGTSATIIVS